MFAALPPDVREVCDLPEGASSLRATPWGIAPIIESQRYRWGRAATAHLTGQAVREGFGVRAVRRQSRRHS